MYAALLLLVAEVTVNNSIVGNEEQAYLFNGVMVTPSNFLLFDRSHAGQIPYRC